MIHPLSSAAKKEAPMNLEIRRYKSTDRDYVWALHITALKSTGTYTSSGAWDQDLFHIEETYLANGGDFLVALHEQCLIGMGALKRVDDTTGEIKRMRVDPAYQGKGIGQKLLTLLITRAQDLGYERLILDTTVKQIAAQHLYERNGFQEIRRGVLGGFETIYYKKRL